MADTARHSVLPATEKDAALGRIGYYRYTGKKGKGEEPDIDAASIVNWFIRLANQPTPLRERAPSEIELLKMDYRALQEQALPYYENLVTVEALDRFRETVKGHLDEYADTGKTAFGPFTLTRVLYRMPISAPKSQPVGAGTLVEPEDGNGLLHLLSVLLERLPIAVLRCPQCHHVFLQPRQDARYCSRPCQTRAHARSQREAAKVKQLRSRGKRRVEKHKRVRTPVKIQERPRRRTRKRP
jgi:hypothetical protein